MWKYLLAFAAGAGVEYLLDPDRGRRRRHIARDRLFSLARHAGVQAGRRGRALVSRTNGAIKHARYTLIPPEPKLLEGVALAQKVRSEVFGEMKIPRGKVFVSAVDRVIELRGELESKALIEALEARVSAVPGVLAVDNMLHLPGQGRG